MINFIKGEFYKINKGFIVRCIRDSFDGLYHYTFRYDDGEYRPMNTDEYGKECKDSFVIPKKIEITSYIKLLEMSNEDFVNAISEFFSGKYFGSERDQILRNTLYQWENKNG